MNVPPIRLILDTSAILAYARESVDVGETIGEITDEGVAFGLPVLCLAEAGLAAKPDELELMLVLARHPQAERLGTLPRWLPLAMAARLYGSISEATVALAAGENRAYVMTAHPAVYGDLPTIQV